MFSIAKNITQQTNIFLTSKMIFVNGLKRTFLFQFLQFFIPDFLMKNIHASTLVISQSSPCEKNKRRKHTSTTPQVSFMGYKGAEGKTWSVCGKHNQQELEVWFRIVKEVWKQKLKQSKKKNTGALTILGKPQDFLIIIYNSHHYKHMIAIFISYI